MGNIWLSSDWHLNHNKILEYEKETRPFNTIEEMNKTIIDNYNETVKFGDDFYMLGDFILGDASKVGEFIASMQHGSIRVIPGNHCTSTKIQAYKDCGLDVLENLYIYKYSKSKKIFMCHYPLCLSHQDMVRDISLHGHTHQHTNFSNNPYTYHVGVDSHALYPVNLDQVVNECMTQWSNHDKNINSNFNIF